LAPEYEKAATALLSSDPPVPLAKVDLKPILAQNKIMFNIMLQL